MNHTICFDKTCAPCNTRYGVLGTSWTPRRGELALTLQQQVTDTMLKLKQSFAPTLYVPTIPRLTARAVTAIPTASAAPASVLTISQVNYAAMLKGDWVYEPNPPKVPYAFLAMISE